MRQVLSATDTVSTSWSGIGGELYILLSGTVSDPWKLQEQDPDGDWIDISPESGGMSDPGGWWYRARATARYRLSGTTAGAKAWITNASGYQVELLN